ncbi:MAG: hypothetical protein IPJ53_08875 [Saprospiraceae bacterium]|nr:hypothetical protein [Candidatus Vicinibacter affinis]
MIDYISLDISYLGKEKLLSNPHLNFERPFRIKENGEIEVIEFEKGKVKPELEANYKNLKFQIYRNGAIYLKGSLHVFWNDGVHNYNDFGIEDLKTVLKELETKFGIIPEKTKIRHLEFGVNLQDLPYDTHTIIKNIMFHNGKGKPHEYRYIIQRTASEYKAIEKRVTFSLKCYDKAKHKDQEGNIFRFECKSHKSVYLNELGIIYLSDLINTDAVKRLGNRLVQLWRETVIRDWTINLNNLKKKDRIKILEWHNTNYWIDLFENTRGKDRNKFNRELSKYQKLVQEHHGNAHKTIEDAISEKWCKITTENKTIGKQELVQDHTIIIHDLAPICSNTITDSENAPGTSKETRVCKVTGIDISHQKEGSSFLRETTLKTIKEKEPKIYEYLKLKFGPKLKQPKDQAGEFEMIAKNIRNQDSNPRAQQRALQHKKELAVIRYQNSLFPLQTAQSN